MLVESMDLHRQHTLRELAAWYEKKRHALGGAEGDGGHAFFRLLSVKRDKEAEAGSAEAHYDLLIEQVTTKVDEHLLGDTGDPANLGNGVINIDTRLFLHAPGSLLAARWEPVEGAPHQWTRHCENTEELTAATRWLRDAATELYHDSELVPWLCEHVAPLAPLVALYLKCDVGVE